MHYRNGRPAQNGDRIVLIDPYGNLASGILYDAKPGSSDCNGRIAPILPSNPIADLKHCLHADDIRNAVAFNIPTGPTTAS